MARFRVTTRELIEHEIVDLVEADSVEAVEADEFDRIEEISDELIDTRDKTVLSIEPE